MSNAICFGKQMSEICNRETCIAGSEKIYIAFEKKKKNNSAKLRMSFGARCTLLPEFPSELDLRQIGIDFAASAKRTIAYSNNSHSTQLTVLNSASEVFDY